MNVSISPDLEAYIQRQLTTGHYRDASEVVQDALRLMQAHEDATRAAPGKDDVVAAVRALEAELRGRGVVSAALFGSVRHGVARPDSDVDVLITVDPAVRFDLVDLVGVRNLLADRLGRDVDVVERGSLKPLLRDGILADAETVFA